MSVSAAPTYELLPDISSDKNSYISYTKTFEEMLKGDKGFFIVSGFAASGKTTAINKITQYKKDQGKKVLNLVFETNENPFTTHLICNFEHQDNHRLEVFNVNHVIKNTLRAVKAYKPDVIVIDELRQGQEVGLAYLLASKGYQVYATIHSNKNHLDERLNNLLEENPGYDANFDVLVKMAAKTIKPNAELRTVVDFKGSLANGTKERIFLSLYTKR